MKATIVTVLSCLGIATLPTLALAATFQYVSVTGQVLTHIAPNAETAIMTAPNIAPTSGVMLVDGTNEMLPSDRVPIDPSPPATP